MKKKNYPVRKKVAVHTTVGVGIWNEIKKIAKKRDVPKTDIVNEVLVEGLSNAKYRSFAKRVR